MFGDVASQPNFSYQRSHVDSNVSHELRPGDFESQMKNNPNICRGMSPSVKRKANVGSLEDAGDQRLDRVSLPFSKSSMSLSLNRLK